VDLKLGIQSIFVFDQILLTGNVPFTFSLFQLIFEPRWALHTPFLILPFFRKNHGNHTDLPKDMAMIKFICIFGMVVMIFVLCIYGL